MRTLVEALPCDILLPPALVPVLPATPHAFLNAIAGLSREVAKASSLDCVEAAADAVARAAVVRSRIDAVLVPGCLRGPSPTDRHRVASARLRWAFEERGVLLLMPIEGDRGAAIVALTDNHLTVVAMHEPDPRKRAQAWQARWALLVEQERQFGKPSPERSLVARYLADDPEVRAVLKSDAPAWLAELDGECRGQPPIPWRKAVREMQRLPSA